MEQVSSARLCSFQQEVVETFFPKTAASSAPVTTSLDDFLKPTADFQLDLWKDTLAKHFSLFLFHSKLSIYRGLVIVMPRNVLTASFTMYDSFLFSHRLIIAFGSSLSCIRI